MMTVQEQLQGEKQRLSRREFMRLTAFVTSGALIAACAPAAPGAAPGGAAGAAEAQTSITVWWNPGPTQLGVVEAFQNANPTLTVELTDPGETVYGNPKYVTAVAAGTGPTVSYQNRHTFHQFAARKLFR